MWLWVIYVCVSPVWPTRDITTADLPCGYNHGWLRVVEKAIKRSDLERKYTVLCVLSIQSSILEYILVMWSRNHFMFCHIRASAGLNTGVCMHVFLALLLGEVIIWLTVHKCVLRLTGYGSVMAERLIFFANRESPNENVWISIKISLKFVPEGQINNIPALVRIMAWCWPGDKPLSEPMMLSLLTHIYVTRPQQVC